MSQPALASWSEKALKHWVESLDGRRIPLSAEERGGRQGAYPYYGASGVIDHIDGFLFNEPLVLVAEDGANLLSRSTPIAFLATGKYWVNNHAHVLKPRSGPARYWAYRLESVDVTPFITGSAQPKFTAAALMDMRVTAPESVDEQDAIADFLDRETAQIDTLTVEQQRLVEMLRVRKRAVLDQVTGAASGTRVRLKYLFAPSSEANHPDEEVLSVYRDYGVIPKSSRDDNFNRTPENVARYLLVRPGDLVINRMKAWQGSLGVSEYRGIVSGDYEVVRPIGNRLLPRFAHLFLRSPLMVADYAVRSTGIRPSQWRLYWDQMGNVEVPVPPPAEQAGIVERIDEQTTKIDTLIAETERFIELARERRAALIAAAVTGQIAIRAEVD
ncbi:restriction endonuclease subunit S [Williamsia sp. CHRR-6]|uniref:restriction endonuclease subunit S n=1 Tax=Williamsia sp. CHRR-6 TaxID=2835871 RepID=UPI001BD96104|nr:restriction endonuclease subunit S [Williamsia sp. CHRR-6]MBT0567831.1 restriction endonuclease subunit S [Williamsia sp. CHRR-6]